MKASETQVGGPHYKDMGEFQPWDVLQHWLTPEEYRGYQKGVVIAYLARERGKGGDQDIRKAAHHLNKLVEVLDAAEAQHAATAPVVIPPAPDYMPDSVALHVTGNTASRAALDVVAANAADDGWIPWGGGECPVWNGTSIQYKYHMSDVVLQTEHPESLSGWNHELTDRIDRIASYRVVPRSA